MPHLNVPTGKAFQVFQEIIALEGGAFSPKEESTRLGIPTPNLYRYLDLLIKSGLLVRARRSHYLPHPNFLKLLEPYNGPKVLGLIVRPLLEQAAKEVKATFHFGVLEADMVTYVTKVDRHKMGLFTKENMQLEAYCSAIGKCLLSSLPQKNLNDYISAFDFPALTSNTITDPSEIRREITRTRRRGYGVDNREIREDLVCIAVPVVLKSGVTIGAVSAASTSIDLAGAPRAEVVRILQNVAQQIAEKLR